MCFDYALPSVSTRYFAVTHFKRLECPARVGIATLIPRQAAPLRGVTHLSYFNGRGALLHEPHRCGVAGSDGLELAPVGAGGDSH
jgi:hypothetical protein